jgi:hypothetical protein
MIDKSKRVYVYFNLHKKVFSVRQSGRIVEHTKHVLLKDCRFLVGQAGRKKVLQEKRKNVHAGVSGYVVDHVPNVPEYSSELTYNPYKHETFVSKDDPCEPVDHSDYAELTCGNGWRNVEAMWQ